MIRYYGGIPMKILEELWYKNIDPRECGSPKDPRVERVLFLAAKNDDAMRAMLSDTQKEQYEKARDCQNELTDLLERKAFSSGFCLAVKIMIDVINTMGIPSVDD